MKPDFKDVRARFLRDGVVILEDFFSIEELAEANRVLDELLTLSVPTDTATFPDAWKQFETTVQGLGGAGQTHSAFLALGKHAGFEAVTQAALGCPYEDELFLIQVTRTGTGQAWHQDTPCGDPALFNVNRLIYTRDVPTEQGSVVVVPGSHLRGRIPPGGNHASIDGELVLSPRAGTLVFLDTRTWHRVTKNQTPRPRASVNYRIRPAGVPAGYGRMGVFRNATYDFAKQEALPV